MTSFDPATVRQAVAEFTPLRPQKFQDLLPAKDVIADPATGKALFKGKATARIEPGGGAVSIELAKVGEADAKVGTELEVVVEDADNDELLERRPVTLKVELNDWD